MSDSLARQFINCSKFHNWSTNIVFRQPSMWVRKNADRKRLYSQTELTRSSLECTSDSSVLSIPYDRTSLGTKKILCHCSKTPELPPEARNSLSLSTFWSKFRTHLFKLAFLIEFSSILSIADCVSGFDSCFFLTFSPTEWYLVFWALEVYYYYYHYYLIRSGSSQVGPGA